VMTERSAFAAFFNDAMADNAPLFEMVSRFANDDMLAKIANEYTEKGRLLFIGTTDLDASRSVIWDMGAIAASDYPDKLTLFRRILVASAAIPGAFPPTMIDVEADGQRFQEMHVDGGARSQVFVYPAAVRASDIIKKQRFQVGDRYLYVIRNDRTEQSWASVERQTVSIAGRAISSLIHKEGMGDLYEIFLLTQRDGLDFNLAMIEPEFTATSDQMFEPTYMTALFEFGHRLGREGYPWRKQPPGFEVSTQRTSATDLAVAVAGSR
jgi:predicted acylesterase/phospholipase RssA